MALLRLPRSGGAAAAAAMTSHLLRRFLCSPPPPGPPHRRYSLSIATSAAPFSPHLSSGDHLRHRPLLADFDGELAGGAELRAALELISRTRDESSSREEALASLRDSGVELAGDVLPAAIWQLREDWESALLAFQWGGERLLSDSPRPWHLIIWVLAKNHRFGTAWFLLRKMHRLRILTHLPLLILIEGYAAANEPRKAIKTFRAMEKLGLAADSSSFYELLRALCKHKNVEEAEELLLSNRGLFPLKVEGFNIILEGWCSAMADLAEAKRCWREMAALCISPDGASYALMIGCFSRAGNLFDSMRLYDEMKKKGWPPGISVYNALIYALAGEGLAAPAKKLMKKMEDLGLEPSAETYNSLILPLCEARKVDEARETMEEMIRRGITPTAETHKAFLKAEDMAGTMALLQRMSGGAADGSVFLLLLEKFLRWEQAGNALRIWAEMGKHGVEKEGAHYLALVRGLVACGWKPKAMELYREMKARGFMADPKLERLFTEVEGRGRRGGRRRAERGKVG